MSTLSGTLCTAAMQPEWMLPPRAPLLGPGPSDSPRPVPALPRDLPARSPIAPPPQAAPPPRGFNPAGPYHSAREGGGYGPEKGFPWPRGDTAHPRAPPTRRLPGSLGAARQARGSDSPPGGASPPSFCRAVSWEWKRPDPLTQDEETGTMICPRSWS